MEGEDRRMPWEEELDPADFVPKQGGPKRLAVSALYADLLVAAVEIGGICDMANWAGAGVAGRVYATGKKLDDITIGEMVGLIKEQERYHALIEDLITLGPGEAHDQ